jgi:hypothetical protein
MNNRAQQARKHAIRRQQEEMEYSSVSNSVSLSDLSRAMYDSQNGEVSIAEVIARVENNLRQAVECEHLAYWASVRY